jgi:universal stress protein E
MKRGQLLVLNFASVPQPDLMRRGRDVAAALKQDLIICCLLDDAELPPALPGRSERVKAVRKKLIARCSIALDKVLEEASVAGVCAHGEVKAANSVKDAALELVRRLSPSFVLICRRPRSRLREVTLSGNDFEIMRTCPVPVWVVNPENRSGDKIVGAIDRPDGNGSKLDGAILEKASHLARKLGKEPHALHTFGHAGLPQPLEPAARDPQDDMGASRYDRRMRRIFEFGKTHGVPRNRIHIHEGKLINALEEMSEPMNADLIILGARHRGRLSRLFSGSSAERVIQRVKSDVLILNDRGPQAAEDTRRLH